MAMEEADMKVDTVDGEVVMMAATEVMKVVVMADGEVAMMAVLVVMAERDTVMVVVMAMEEDTAMAVVMKEATVVMKEATVVTKEEAMAVITEDMMTGTQITGVMDMATHGSIITTMIIITVEHKMLSCKDPTSYSTPDQSCIIDLT